MRVLGIDPGSLRTGWGVIDRLGTKLVLVDTGVICTRSKDDLALRLRTIYEGLMQVISQTSPTTVAVEDVFFSQGHAASALKLGQARGAALLAASLSDLSVASYPPALVKRSVGGSGQADKAQVGRMIGAILGMRVLPISDATDALAVAVTHCQAHHMMLATGTARSLAQTLQNSRSQRPQKSP